MTDIDLNFERITERTEDEVHKLREFRMSDLPDA